MNRALQTNILWTVVSRFGSQILAAISSLILARYLGSSGFGEYAFISAVVMIGNALSTFGTDMVLIRRISSDNDYSDLSTTLAIQLLISCLFIAGVFVFYSFLPVTPSLLIYAFALIPLAFFTVFTTALRGAQEMRMFSLLNFWAAFFQMIAAFVLIFQKQDVSHLSLLLIGTQTLAALLGFLLCFLRIENFLGHWQFSLKRVLPLLRSSFQMALIGTFRLLYEKLALTLLPILAGVNVTGLFSASLRVTNVANLGHASALTAIYPEMARDKKFTAHRTGLVLLLFTAACISLVLFLFSPQIILFLFGDQFMESISSLRILSWILIPNFFVLYYSLAFVAQEVERPVLRSLVTSLLLMLILLVTLSPLYGLRGAAFALLSAESFQALMLWLQWRTHAFSKSPE